MSSREALNPGEQPVLWRARSGPGKLLFHVLDLKPALSRTG